MLLQSSDQLLLLKSAGNLGPGFLPPLIAGNVAQGHHRIDVLARPMHPGLFHSRLDDYLVGALDTPAADRITVCLRQSGVTKAKRPVRYRLQAARCAIEPIRE